MEHVKELVDIMYSRVRVNSNGCFEYTGPLNSCGYGAVSYKGSTSYAHRISAQHYFGQVLKSENIVAHKCDNRKCFNPAHLFVTDVAGNNQDMHNKGRWSLARSLSVVCSRGHSRTPDNIYEYKGIRKCRECRTEADKARQARNKAFKLKCWELRRAVQETSKG